MNEGFILTRTSFDQAGGVRLVFWAATGLGPARIIIDGQRPVFFSERYDDAQVVSALASIASHEAKALQMKTFAQMPVCAHYTATMQASYRARGVLQGAGIVCHETDIRPHERFLMERFIRAGIEIHGKPQRREGFIEYLNPRLKPGDRRMTLSTLSLDIECDIDGGLYSVGLSGCGVDQVLMIGVPQALDDIDVIWCRDEEVLLKTLVRRISALDADVIIGWNVINFDLRLLLARAKKFGVRFAIGRDGGVPGWRSIRGETEKGFISIPGRVAIDGIDALRCATYSFPSYSLEFVAQTILGRGKLVEQDVDERLHEIRRNFKYNKPALARYNLEDCRLAAAIFEKTRLINFLALRAQITGLEIERMGGSVAAFSHLYMPHLHRSGYVAPNHVGEGVASPGGYVMDSKPGLYDNVLVVDFKSLYPSIIRTFKIDPMGMIEGLHNAADSIPGFRGARFHRQRHHLPAIIASLWQKRDIARRNHDAARAQAIKILMNSFYGVLGTSGCRFYDPRLASSITMRGHEILQTTSRWIEEMGYPVIYGDTDSLFIRADDVRPGDCAASGARIVSEINRRWVAVLREDYDLDCFLELEFECHFEKFLMPTVRGAESGSKKRYAGLRFGYESVTERMVFKGLEAVRTDWTELARSFQLELYRLVFTGEDASDYVRDMAANTLAGRFDDDLVYRKQLRQSLDEYVRNIPPHVRAARLADEQLAASGRRPRYQHKGWISYVITVQGPEPLEFRKASIDYHHYVDKQLKPVADAILPFVGLDFDALISAQTSLF